jgi:hypothetical protein
MTYFEGIVDSVGANGLKGDRSVLRNSSEQPSSMISTSNFEIIQLATAFSAVLKAVSMLYRHTISWIIL